MIMTLDDRRGSSSIPWDTLIEAMERALVELSSGRLATTARERPIFKGP